MQSKISDDDALARVELARWQIIREMWLDGELSAEELERLLDEDRHSQR